MALCPTPGGQRPARGNASLGQAAEVLSEAFLEEVLGAMDKDEADEFKDVKNTVKGKRVAEKKLKWKELHQSRLAEKAESRTQRQVCYIIYVNHGLMVCKGQ